VDFNITPTEATYNDLVYDYLVFNDRLFGDTLPDCLITFQRKGNSSGYFCRERFDKRPSDSEEFLDEIALNPAHFHKQTDEEIFAVLVHEMVHLLQFRFGKPSRGGYHNREWGTMMKSVGLYPSNTGKPGGRETGQQMTHYIIPEGPFAVVCAALLDLGIKVHYEDKPAARAKKKTESKVKYACPSCGLNAWAKPGVELTCDKCQTGLLRG
jgi:hypothetical protein